MSMPTWSSWIATSKPQRKLYAARAAKGSDVSVPKRSFYAFATVSLKDAQSFQRSKKCFALLVLCDTDAVSIADRQ